MQQADQTLFVALGTATVSSGAERDGCPRKQMPLAEEQLLAPLRGPALLPPTPGEP